MAPLHPPKIHHSLINIHSFSSTPNAVSVTSSRFVKIFTEASGVLFFDYVFSWKLILAKTSFWLMIFCVVSATDKERNGSKVI